MPTPKPPVSVVCAVIERGGRFLLAERPPGKKLAGLWEFPGGKIEPGETPEAALHRELEEELGCQVQVDRAGPPFVYEYDWGAISLHPFLCRLTQHSPEPAPHEHTRLTWATWPELRHHPLAPADEPVVDWLAQCA